MVATTTISILSMTMIMIMMIFKLVMVLYNLSHNIHWLCNRIATTVRLKMNKIRLMNLALTNNLK
jgi:hypothetical protein